MKKIMMIAVLVMLWFPLVASAQQQTRSDFRPAVGDREFSISGAGSGDRSFDSGNFSVVGELGWYWMDNVVVGIRQSINYASIEDANFANDFWNGSTRGYINWQFGLERTRPFLGGSLGYIYGDGIRNSGFAGLEGGVKHYVLPQTYLLGRVEYQWFFNRSDRVADAFRRNAIWVYTVGLGFNF